MRILLVNKTKDKQIICNVDDGEFYINCNNFSVSVEITISVDKLTIDGGQLLKQKDDKFDVKIMHDDMNFEDFGLKPTAINFNFFDDDDEKIQIILEKEY